MKVGGFTFIKNALQFDYPIKEAITSILPLCDEFVVAVGDCDDGTRELIENIDHPNLKIIDTVWDNSLREGGHVLAEETNKAFKALSDDCDWCFYIQGDEVVHEQYLETIKEVMLQWKDDQRVEGLLFRYKHFYGSYDYVGDSSRWYKREVRIIRKDPEIYSFRDAQGFQKKGRPLRVKPVDAFIYHYGWVKHPEKQQEKQKNFNKLWHDDHWIEENINAVEEFDYSKIDSLQKFKGTHPKVMQDRIKAINWEFTFDPTTHKMSLKNKFKYAIEKRTGWRVGEYKNFKII